MPCQGSNTTLNRLLWGRNLDHLSVFELKYINKIGFTSIIVQRQILNIKVITWILDQLDLTGGHDGSLRR